MKLRPHLTSSSYHLRVSTEEQHMLIAIFTTNSKLDDN